jgi:UDP-glucose 4-epimerase
MRKCILVTGGAGYIGSHTCVQLWEAGYQPIVLDNLSNSQLSMMEGIGKIIGTQLPFYHIDCCDPQQVRSVFDAHTIEGIIHFAAFKSVAESVAHPEKYFSNNMGSLENILSIMKERKVKNLVFSSSCTVYGEPDENPVNENTPWQNAASPYGHTKQMGEKAIQNAQIDFPLGSVILRYFNPIGAHPSGLIGELPIGIPNNLVPVLIQKIKANQNLQVFGDDYPTPDGSCIRDYIHVVDLANAHVKALQWLENNPLQTEVFNIGQGKGNSVLEIIQLFEKANGIPVSYQITQRREGDISKIWADTKKAQHLLIWEPERTTEDALKDAWHFHLTNQ